MTREKKIDVVCYLILALSLSFIVGLLYLKSRDEAQAATEKQELCSTYAYAAADLLEGHFWAVEDQTINLTCEEGKLLITFSSTSTMRAFDFSYDEYKRYFRPKKGEASVARNWLADLIKDLVVKGHNPRADNLEIELSIVEYRTYKSESVTGAKEENESTHRESFSVYSPDLDECSIGHSTAHERAFAQAWDQAWD